MQLKDISQSKLSYIRELPVGEFAWLDFKDSRWLDLSQKCLDKLSEYVSAYANYDGCYLVIGVKDPRPGQPLDMDDGVQLDIKPDLKAWLEDIIPNLTDPPVRRLNVHLITSTPAHLSHTDHVMVVIHIPQSDAAPHQARGHKYYARTGTKLGAVGHQAILDILHRKRNPIIRTEIFVNFNQGPG